MKVLQLHIDDMVTVISLSKGLGSSLTPGERWSLVW
jgi:hypothetical protein